MPCCFDELLGVVNECLEKYLYKKMKKYNHGFHTGRHKERGVRWVLTVMWKP